ncbi:hypothetical protein BDD43_2055 [Mucilaginibacter gracilis]|uniref:Uncharacterized protein n=1 Tax=Mucilaginibacter gracilis TaxID=423350 RepID=A0A495J0Q5_9SPHI|nr:hypothetical protein [Mucilaginibacter gracilis]RKR81894.1 hypothetical protein BDD43_2055 [Mucilaginibacter gracilis]
MTNQESKLSPEKILSLLKKQDIHLTPQEAKQLLSFFSLLSDILIDDFLTR